MLKHLYLATLLSTTVFGETYFKETFSDVSNFNKRWVNSKWKEDMGKFELSGGQTWKVDEEIEQGLQTSQNAKFYAISSKLDKPFSNKNEDLVVQFSVKNDGKGHSFCAGGYLKLLSSQVDQDKFGGETDYHIMFGPDLCGYDVSRVHLIFNHNGKNLLKKDDIKLEYADKNDKTHLYTLVVKPDNTFEVYIDEELRSSGGLHDNWEFPPEEIPDPKDVKPTDWVDEAYLDDPEDVKPEGYDDIKKMIEDPEAKKPDDWDDEDDGDWKPPMIENPEFKGPWKAQQIANPDYKGEWVQKKIPNPDFVKDVYFYEDIGAVGFELWVVNKGSIFDNIYIGNSLEEAKKFAKETFGKISPLEEEIKKKYDEEKKALEDEADEDDEEDGVKEEL